MQLPALLFGVYMKEKKPNARLTKHAKQEMNHLNHQGQKASILRLMVQLVHTFHPPTLLSPPTPSSLYWRGVHATSWNFILHC